MHTCIDSKHHGAKTQSTDRQSQFEVTTSLRSNTACSSVLVGYGVKMKRRLYVRVQSAVVIFLWSWQRCRRSKIGCCSARRGTAFHCIAWEMFEHWRKNNRWPGGGGGGLEVFRQEVPRTSLSKRTWTKRHRLNDRSSAWQTRPFKWRRPWAVLRHFYFLFFVDTRSILS